MKLSVCVDAVFRGGDMTQSLETVQRLGYAAFECWGWWDKDLELLRREKERLGLELAACCTRFVSLVDPRQREAYLDGLRESIAAARSLDCRTLISQCGGDTGAPREEQFQSLVQGLRQAAPLLEEAGVTLVLEPLNGMDHPGYYLSSSGEAARAVREAESPSVKILYDIYHQQITEGDILRGIERNIGCIGHFHAAGNPGRHELYRSELDYGYIFTAIRELGWEGAVGLEYFPADPPEQGLAHALVL